MKWEMAVWLLLMLAMSGLFCLVTGNQIIVMDMNTIHISIPNPHLTLAWQNKIWYVWVRQHLPINSGIQNELWEHLPMLYYPWRFIITLCCLWINIGAFTWHGLFVWKLHRWNGSKCNWYNDWDIHYIFSIRLQWKFGVSLYFWQWKKVIAGLIVFCAPLDNCNQKEGHPRKDTGDTAVRHWNTVSQLMLWFIPFKSWNTWRMKYRFCCSGTIKDML